MQKTGTELKLIIVKSVHTAIWLVFVTAILFILWSGITAHISVYSWIAVAAVCGEGLVLFIFKGSCPLTKIARRYSDSTKNNFDIYLPERLAKYNKHIFTTLFFAGLALMIWRWFLMN